MSFLATADLQCEWSNLDLCSESWYEMLEICFKNHIKLIVFCGDGKEAYDPVSIRIVKWWQWAIKRAGKCGITVVYLMGNHDRIATYSEAGNWLSILRSAGAVTFDAPGFYLDGNRWLFMLPYAGVKQTKEWARDLLKHKPDRHKDVLFFHANLLEARYSQHEHHSDSALSISDLCHDRYLFCIGGDIHFPQKMENVYYVGSSFCHDWGEVNQRKRYLVVRGSHITSVHSAIPRWFDPSIPGFRRSKPSTYAGARVRLQVLCSASEDYESKIERVRKSAQAKYKGAELYVVPKFLDERAAEQSFSKDDTDEVKLREYIKQTAISRELAQLALSYMIEKLSYFSHGLRKGSRFRFKYAKAVNYLGYEKVKFDYTQKGIIVVNGVNHDRGNKSNGAGKTSLTNMIPVSWFGKTFKGQSHDKWSNRFHPKRQSFVEVCGKNSKHDEVLVRRGRRPTELKLLIDGKNQSAGMKSTDSTGTQAHIEQVTGFTWDTLANAVYIDRTICDAFLSGTKAQRTEVLSRFQNLERFTKALKLVKQDISRNIDKEQELKEKLGRVRGRMEESTKNLGELKKLHGTQIGEAKREYKQAKSKYKLYKIPDKLRFEANNMNERYKKALKQRDTIEKAVTVLVGERNQAKLWVEKWRNLEQKEYCPTCYQDLSSKQFAIHFKKDKQKLVKAKFNLNVFEKKLSKAQHKFEIVSEEFDRNQAKYQSLIDKKSKLRLIMHQTHNSYRHLASSQHGAAVAIEKSKQELRGFKYKKEALKASMVKLRDRRMVYLYAMQAFSRDGIPAFLNSQLCPVLNKASDYYANLFSDMEIQVRFKVKAGEFVPQIINAKGGEGIKAQSEGERALAGLISSFALREAAPETNLLILDEPGSGLDEQTAKQFARSLKVLNERFKLIIVTTHNPVILSALASERTITVHKRDGISTLAS